MARKKRQGEVDRDSQDYIESLSEQLDFLVTNCKIFDQGKFHYAKQIATNIRVILYDSRTSISILTHLNRIDTMKFCSTAAFPKKPVYFNGMTSPLDRYNEKNQLEHIFVPNINANKEHGKKWVDFDTWFQQKVLVSDPDSFTRKEMLLFIVNQDGGAHVDPYIQEKYYKISKGIQSVLYTSPRPFELGAPYQNLHFAIIRQIAHELILSIRKEFGIRPNYNPTIRNYNNGNDVSVFGLMVTKGDKLEFER